MYKLYLRGRLWYVAIDTEGGTIRLSTGETLRERAEKRAREMARDRGVEDRSPVSVSVNWSEAWGLYERWASSRLKANSIMFNNVCWRMFWENAGVSDIGSVTVEDVERWVAQERKRVTRRGDVVSPVTINGRLTGCCTVYDWLLKGGFVTEPNPFTASAAARISTAPRRPKFLTKDEIEVVLGIASQASEHAYLFCMLGLYAGLRKREILELKWQDIHMDRADQDGRALGCLYVWGDGERTTKTTKSNRVVPLHPELRVVFSKLERDPDQFIVRPWATKRGPEGYRWNPRVLFQAISKELGHPVSPHTLRHTFASQLAQRGVSIFKISAWLGHTSVETTQVYAHVAPVDEEIGRL